MTRLVILGTAWAVPSPSHHNTHLAVENKQGIVLVDCPGSPSIRLSEANITIDSISDVILTHFHPDHVGGIPLLLMNMWMLGREDPLRIYGLHHCLKRLEDMMAFFHWENWPHFFPIAFHRLPEREKVLVLETEGLKIYSSPVRHVIPTIGLRIDHHEGASISYSSDTEPCPSMVRLAQGSNILIHEATGAIVGHSSASQAGAIAREAQVEQLILVHYKAGEVSPKTLAEQAHETFSGEVIVAQDLKEIQF